MEINSIDNRIFYVTGAKKDKKDRRDNRVRGITAVGAIPKQRFVLDDAFPSKNQYQRGSCISQAQAHHKERQEKKTMSARFIMANTKKLEGNIEYGGYTRNSFKVVNKIGACSEDLLPEPGPQITWEEYIDVNKIPENCFKDAERHKSQSYWRVNNIDDEIKSTFLNHHNSMVLSMAWYSEFNRPSKETGILPTEYSNYAGGHAVEIRGWDDFKEYWILKNSWGEGWGKNGEFNIPFSMFHDKKFNRDLIWDIWTSLDIPEKLPVDEYYGEKRTWTTYVREKSIAFNPWLHGQIDRLPNNREISALAYGFYPFAAVFRGSVGDAWLYMTYPEYLKKNG